MIPIAQLGDHDSEDRRSLSGMANRAIAFLSKHRWCNRIIQGFLDYGWEGILGVFFFEIEPASPQVDRTMWVIVGDVPPAYICNDNPDGVSALEAYVREMERWVNAVRLGESLEAIIPVNAPPSIKYADMLDSRLGFIREKLLPEYYVEKGLTRAVYVILLGEGTKTMRPVEGIPMGDNVYKLLEPLDYDPQDEHWQFPPGSLVKCTSEEGDSEEILVARELVSVAS